MESKQCSPPRRLFEQSEGIPRSQQQQSKHSGQSLLRIPCAFRDDPEGLFMRKYGLGSGASPGSTRLKTLFLAGERLDPETQRWASEHLQLPVIDHYWQTETGKLAIHRHVATSHDLLMPQLNLLLRPSRSIAVCSQAGQSWQSALDSATRPWQSSRGPQASRFQALTCDACFQSKERLCPSNYHHLQLQFVYRKPPMTPRVSWY